MKKYTFALAALGLACLVTAACTNVMSTSWGEWAKRDTESLLPTPNADNVADLVDLARGDPAMAKKLLGKLKDQVKKASGEKKAALQGAGISAAAIASGLDTEVIKNASKLIDASKGGGDTDSVMDALDNIFDGVKGNDLTGTANDLVEILADEGTFRDDYNNPSTGKKTTTDDIMVAAMVLLIAQAQEDGYDGDFNGYVDNFKSRQDDEKNGNAVLTEKEKKALFLAGLVSGNSDDGTGDMLGGLGLK